MQATGFVFPGQGSQFVGMLKDIAAEFPQVAVTFQEASDSLGYDLWQLVQEGPAAELDKTVHTQPALLAASYAIWQILQTQNRFTPTLLAGHSLGEYSALVCANAIKFSDGIRLVAARGRYMQEAVPFGMGALAALVGLEDSVVKNICAQAALQGEVLAPANFNSPGQIVISGHKIAVERAIILAKEAGAKLAKLLPVSVPSHCELMKPAADRLAEVLATIPIQTPKISVLNNVDVAIYNNADSIRHGLLRQLYMPVRWVEIMQKFSQATIHTVIECGPGKVLSGLIKRITPQLELLQTTDVENLKFLCEKMRNKV